MASTSTSTKNSKMKTTLFLSLALAASSLVAAQLPDEANFDFQKRLFVLHRTDRLDPTLKPAADEFAFRAGTWAIALPATADDVLRHAAADFADYLKTSMKLDNAGGVSAVWRERRDRVRNRVVPGRGDGGDLVSSA